MFSTNVVTSCWKHLTNAEAKLFLSSNQVGS
jgi:hypothetical protein